jgi:3-oxoacyl-[acyl-carrier protein] reductase
MSKKFLVTGATRGIGHAIASKLLEKGYHVFGTGSQNSARRCEAFKDLNGVSWLDVNFSDRNSLKDFLTTIHDIGPFAGLVNNAGVNLIKPINLVNELDYDYVHDINLRTPYLICREIVGGMTKAGGGRIVNIASIWSEVTKSHRSLYSSSKTGLVGMTRALAAEVGSRGIQVNLVSPGFVLTDMTLESLSPQQIEEHTNQVPMKKMAEPKDIAEVVYFLLSDKNRYINGQNIVVDGGYSII